MVVATYIPDFELKIAARERSMLLGEPVALAPPDSGDRRIGQVSQAAQAQGVASGMVLGEALARCPKLRLVAPDPVGAAKAWERTVSSLEGIGASVFAPQAGTALFEADGLLRLHCGMRGVVEATAKAVREPVRIGAAASSFAARQAAASARIRKARVVGGGEQGAREFLAPLSVASLLADERAGMIVPTLARLGINTLGRFAALSPATISDRFGRVGIEARELALGRGPRLIPRTPPLQLAEEIDIPESTDGSQLGHALGLLVARLLARPDRKNRTVRAVELQASLETGGTWMRPVCFREALDNSQRITLALRPALAGIPAPAGSLRLLATALGPQATDARSLIEEPQDARIARLREAILQTRTAGGPDAALRVVEVEPDSRLPERRMALAPFEV